MKITVLGCGSSTGVPHPTLGWGTCIASNLKNRRTRSSVLIEAKDISILIDTSPDLRQQLLNLGYIPQIDAVFYTHVHYDHTAGIGELRPMFYKKNTLTPVYGTQDVIDYIHQIGSFMFENTTDQYIYHPVLSSKIIDGDFILTSKNKNILNIRTFQMQHGVLMCTGYRINNFAYATDVKTFPDGELDKLHGLDVLIIDCLTHARNSIAHANLTQVLEWVEKVHPKMTYLTHMDLSMDYDTLIKELPDYIKPAYDGLVIEV